MCIMWVWAPLGARGVGEKDIGSTGTGVMDGCEQPCRC